MRILLVIIQLYTNIVSWVFMGVHGFSWVFMGFHGVHKPFSIQTKKSTHSPNWPGRPGLSAHTSGQQWMVHEN